MSCKGSAKHDHDREQPWDILNDDLISGYKTIYLCNYPHYLVFSEGIASHEGRRVLFLMRDLISFKNLTDGKRERP